MAKSPEFSQKEVAENQESRTLSDAELMKGGAHYVPTENGESRLEVTAEQIEKIKSESVEEQRILVQKFEAQEHEGIEAFEKEIDDFIKSFPVENPTKEDIHKLLEYLYSTGSHTQGFDMVGESAKKMGFPVEEKTYPTGMHGMATRTTYRMGKEVREVAEKVLRRADEKLTKLALEVAEKQEPKVEKEFGNKFNEILAFIRKDWPNVYQLAAEDAYKMLGMQASPNFRDERNKERNEKAKEYERLLDKYFASKKKNVKSISGAMDFLSTMSW
jgi:hypothetical protein